METGTVVIVLVVAAVAVLAGLALGWALASTRTAEQRRRADVQVAEARAHLEAERAAAAQRLTSSQADQERLTEQFRVLAADALATNNERFLTLADQRLAASHQGQVRDLTEREESIKALVDPIAQTLANIQAEMTTAEKSRATTHATLTEQVRSMRETSEALRSETSQLVTALRSSQVRGRWGELQLRRVVESAGMLDHVDFVEQASARTDDGVQRPDMVVHLSGGKQVVLDAKVAFLGYLEAVQATDEAVRTERMSAHVKHVRKHVDDLAAKAYWEQFSPTPEFVVMFVPAEPFLQAALDADPGLFEYAMERSVILATPMTLLALLRTVAYTWRQEALAANAQQVLNLGRELHGRIGTLGGHFGKLGRQLDGAVRAFNDSVSSLESRVLVSVRRLAELQAIDAELDAPAQVERAARAVQAPELVASDTNRFVALQTELPHRPETATQNAEDIASG